MQPIKVIIFITKSKKGTKGNINLSNDRDTTLTTLKFTYCLCVNS